MAKKTINKNAILNAVQKGPKVVPPKKFDEIAISEKDKVHFDYKGNPIAPEEDEDYTEDEELEEDDDAEEEDEEEPVKATVTIKKHQKKTSSSSEKPDKKTLLARFSYFQSKVVAFEQAETLAMFSNMNDQQIATFTAVKASAYTQMKILANQLWDEEIQATLNAIGANNNGKG